MALFIDRFMLGESATAPLEAEAVAPRRAIVPPENEDGASVPIPAVPFPRNLPAFDATGEIRDVFVSPSDMRAADHGEHNRQVGPKTDDPVGPSSAVEFAARHALNALLDDQSLRIAIVDGRWIKVGGAVDDCRLITISGTAAQFQCPFGEATLEIPSKPVRIRD